ncbi:MAG TPA: hypothetical protein VIV56_10290 [Gemmatimonadales bacterium]
MCLPGRAVAQRVTAEWGVQAIPALTETNVVPGGRSLGELRVVQPAVMLHAAAFGDRLRLIGTVDFEKYTIPHGELSPGSWGESFEDRRHPHTLVHELMLVSGVRRLFAAAGKGFVPFGTDDPMSRPTVRFPVNHHLSQILERAVILAGVRVGPALLEGALFNGDEPVSPGSWPAWDRFGDSWSARLTVTPLEGLEVQGSYAWVKSPEDRGGAAPADRKASASARWERGRWYGEVEWARTATADGAFIFHSVLAEGAVTLGKSRPYVRLERSDRPEEERLFSSRFRTRRPLFDNSILGITRWTVLTGGSALDLSWRTLRYTPFVEASWIGIARVGGGVFDPRVFFGRTRGVALTLGVRLATGMHMPRMGRYGGWPSEATGRMDMPMQGGAEE